MDSNAEEILTSEIIADSLSDVPDDISEIDSDSDAALYKKHPRIICLFSSDEEEEEETTDEEEEEGGEEVDESEWVDEVPPRNKEPFQGNLGHPTFFPYKRTVHDVLKLFIGDDLFHIIATETNRYYHQNVNTFMLIEDKKKKWHDLTVDELKKWFALVLIMGYMENRPMSDFWSTNPLLQKSIFPKTMTMHRFNQIFKYLHFQNNEEIPSGADRSLKIKTIINYFLDRFRRVYKPKQNLTLSEKIIPWHHRLNWTYNVNEITRHGMLVRMIRDSRTGYICNFKLYLSGDTTLRTSINDIIIPYSQVWHHLYMKSVRNAIQIAEDLLPKKIRVCASMKSNSGLPKSLKEVKLRKYGFIHQYKGEVLVQIYKDIDHKNVHVVSTIHNANVMDSGVIYRNISKTISGPNSVIDYYRNMKCSVVHVDKYLPYNTLFGTQQIKWEKKITLFLIHCALFNAFKVYENLHPGCKFKFHKFVLKVIKLWMTGKKVHSNRTQTSNRLPYTLVSTRLRKSSVNLRQHHIVKMSSVFNRVGKRCEFCVTRNIRKVTMYMCKFCKVPLHINCFLKYHRQKNF